MNIQIERLENHTARLTVPIDLNLLEKAKQEAARKISKKVAIPGFRKGKIPYRILVKYVGEGAIVEEAVEKLGNDLYKQALDEAKIEPYGPGSIDDFKLEPEPTLTFTVPMRPTTDLANYRSLRIEFNAPVVEDERVNRSLNQLQESYALIEESRQPVALGNRVTMELYAKLIEDEASPKVESQSEEASPSSEEAHDHHDDHDHEHHHDHGLGDGEFIHEHNAVLLLVEDRDEPAPGFRQALVGANPGEERTFELTYPDNKEEYEALAGKRAQFLVKLKKVETVTLPILNDDFAARVTETEEKKLTLLELRVRMRENLQKALENDAKSQFADEALDKIVEGAVISFPEVMIDDQTEDYFSRLDQELRRQKMTLDDYIRLSGRTREEMKADYRETAVRNIKRSLTLREIMVAEQLQISEEKIEQEIDRMVAQLGDQGQNMRGALDTPQMRENISDNLIQQEIFDRMVAIVKGEAPELVQKVEEVTPVVSEITTEGETAQ